MLFFYKAVSKDGKDSEGSIESSSIDSAISLLQKRDLVIVDIKPVEDKSASTHRFPFTGGVKMNWSQCSYPYDIQIACLRDREQVLAGKTYADRGRYPRWCVCVDRNGQASRGVLHFLCQFGEGV